jgi:hypothetical protein
MALVTAGAGIAFGLAFGFLGAFFATKNERFDRVAEWLFVAFGVLSVPAMLAIAGRLPNGGIAVGAITAIGIVGAVGTGLGELVITLRLVDFRRVAALLTVAFVAFLVWVGGISVLVVTGGGFPAALGWLGLSAIVVGILMLALTVREPGVITGEREPGPIQMAGLVLVMVAVVAWMIWLAANL